MERRSFKRISPKELEEAVASAISALTGTEAKVSLGQWKELEVNKFMFAGTEKYALEMELTVGSAYEPTRIARGSLKDDLDPSTRDDSDTIPF